MEGKQAAGVAEGMQCGAGSRHGTGREQGRRARGEPGQQRGRREPDDAGQEDPLPAVPVAQRPANSSPAIADPRTVTSSTQRPGPVA